MCKRKEKERRRNGGRRGRKGGREGIKRLKKNRNGEIETIRGENGAGRNIICG